jgi:hypothetical protein
VKRERKARRARRARRERKGNEAGKRNRRARKAQGGHTPLLARGMGRVLLNKVMNQSSKYCSGEIPKLLKDSYNFGILYENRRSYILMCRRI